MKTGLKYLILLCFCCKALCAQNTKAIGRYFNELKKTDLHDTSRIILYISLASEFANFKKDSSIYFAEKAEALLALHPKLNLEAEAKYTKGYACYVSGGLKTAQLFVNQALALANTQEVLPLMAKCHNLLGAIAFNTGNFDESLKEYNSKLKIVTSLNDTLSIIETHYNMSLINNDEGLYYRSLEHNYNALHLAQNSKDTLSIMIACEGLGISYTKINDTKNAILYLERALKIAVKEKKVYEQSGIMIDLGNVYRLLGEYDKAMAFYKKGEDIATKNGDKLIKAIALSGKAETYIFLKNYYEATDLFDQALVLYKEINYPKGIAESYLQLTNCELALHNFKEAKAFALNALSVLKNINEKQLEEKTYEALSKAYENLNNPDSAYICFRKHVALKDTLETKAALKKISEYESTIEKDRLEQERQFAQNAEREELIKQKQIKNTIIVAALVILLLLIVVYRNFKLKQKANIEIEEQKKLIEHKNKDILDSINYSKRLQEAVLTSEEEVRKLLPGSFVIYKPKEAVSSDLYFIEEGSDKNEIHVALANCNDAGVPGAFMSIIANSLLKQALIQSGLKTPAQILDFADRELKNFLRGEKNKVIIAKGIDLSYCIINFKTKHLTFAGANNALWLSTLRNGEDLKDYELANSISARKMVCINGDKKALGSFKEEIKFSDHHVQLQEGDILFMYTGAYADDKTKSAEEKKFPKLLNASAHHEADIAKTQLENELLGIQNDKKENKDTCVVCIRI